MKFTVGDLRALPDLVGFDSFVAKSEYDGSSNEHGRFDLEISEFPSKLLLLCTQVRTNEDYDQLPTEVELLFLETVDLDVAKFLISAIGVKVCTLCFSEYDSSGAIKYSWTQQFYRTITTPTFISSIDGKSLGAWKLRFKIEG